MLIWLVLRSLGHQRFDPLQDLAVAAYVSPPILAQAQLYAQAVGESYR